MPSVSSLRANALSWSGVTGGAVTLFGNVGSVLGVAAWVRHLIIQWQYGAQTVWSFLIGWLGVTVGLYDAVSLTFALFIGLITIAALLDYRAERSDPVFTRHRVILILLAIGLILIFGGDLFIAAILYALRLALGPFRGQEHVQTIVMANFLILAAGYFALAWKASALNAAEATPSVTRRLGLSLAATLLIVLFRFVLMLGPARIDLFLLNVQPATPALLVAAQYLPIVIAPLDKLVSRLAAVGVSLGILVGLSVVGSLGIDLSPPSDPG